MTNYYFQYFSTFVIIGLSNSEPGKCAFCAFLALICSYLKHRSDIKHEEYRKKYGIPTYEPHELESEDVS